MSRVIVGFAMIVGLQLLAAQPEDNFDHCRATDEGDSLSEACCRDWFLPMLPSGEGWPGLVESPAESYLIVGPGVPLLVGPGNDAFLCPSPTFRVQASDSFGTPSQIVLQIQGETALAVGLMASGTEISFTLPSTQPLAPGVYSWRAKAVDAHGIESAWSPSRRFAVGLLVYVLDAETRLPIPSATISASATKPASDFAYQEYLETDAEGKVVLDNMDFECGQSVGMKLRTLTPGFGPDVEKGYLSVSLPFICGEQGIKLNAAESVSPKWVSDYASAAVEVLPPNTVILSLTSFPRFTGSNDGIQEEIIKAVQQLGGGQKAADYLLAAAQCETQMQQFDATDGYRTILNNANYPRSAATGKRVGAGDTGVFQWTDVFAMETSSTAWQHPPDLQERLALLSGKPGSILLKSPKDGSPVRVSNQRGYEINVWTAAWHLLARPNAKLSVCAGDPDGAR